MARPTKYTEDKANQIATLLRGGCTRKDAAGSVGIDYTTFLNWMERFPSFSSLVEAAESFAAVKMTTVITKAADGDWRAALEWLKRRRREEWGDSLNLTKTSDDDLLREAAAILNSQGTGGLDGTEAAGADTDAEGNAVP